MERALSKTQVSGSERMNISSRWEKDGSGRVGER